MTRPNNAERYIRQATRGLWGQQKLDAQTELRGAIEDKIYRYTLLRFNEQDALNAALRDLGNPATIARELSSVHSLPTIVKFGLLAGLTALFSLQAAAQMPVINVAPAPREVLKARCDFNPVNARKLGETHAKFVEQQISMYGSQAKAEADCLKNTPNPARFIRISDLKTALQTGGFKVHQDDIQPDRIAVDFTGNGNWTTLTQYVLNGISVREQGYIDGAFLLVNLRSQTSLPLGLHGARNPTLSLGSFKVQLGTEKQPLRATDLLTPLIADELNTLLQKGSLSQHSFENVAYMEDDTYGIALAVAGPNGTIYATLENQPKCKCSEDVNNRFLLMNLHEANGNRIRGPYRSQEKSAIRVNSTAEFFAGRAKNQRVFLVYKIDASDLRNIQFTLIPGVWK